LGLTKRSPTIQTQTLSLHNTKYHDYGTYSLIQWRQQQHVTWPLRICIDTSEASISRYPKFGSRPCTSNSQYYRSL